MKILICCNAGMSSSILVKNVRTYAKEKKLDVTIKATSSSDIVNEVNKWDICLVGPQLIYALSRIRKQLGIPVESIPPLIYATANGEEAYKFALDRLNK